MLKSKKIFTILGIETSCDETAASLLRIAPSHQGATIKIISNIVASQIKIHRKYGGIVPEIAARAHIKKILPVIKEALNIGDSPRSGTVPDAIAVTNGPGLITSLLVGVEAAKTLSYVWGKPLIPVNHLIGHIYANWFNLGTGTSRSRSQSPLFPAVCLVVSGGHTKLILMKDFEKFKEIGSTRDDAAGEAFDKVAKLLGLGYPGGPAISRYAEKSIINNQLSTIKLPRPMINSNDFDFSFSGLKTAVLFILRERKFELVNRKSEIIRKMKYLPQKTRSERIKFIRNICAEFQQAAIDVLVSKTIKAARKYKAKSVLLSGGVAANTELRKQLSVKCQLSNVNFFAPAKKLCTDNAVMIAAAGYFQIIKAQEHKNIKTKEQLRELFDWKKIKVNPNLEI